MVFVDGYHDGNISGCAENSRTGICAIERALICVTYTYNELTHVLTELPQLCIARTADMRTI